MGYFLHFQFTKSGFTPALLQIIPYHLRIH
jgi:hypothetical protein